MVQNAIFRGKCYDNKILKVKILLSRNLVVMAKLAGGCANDAIIRNTESNLEILTTTPRF